MLGVASVTSITSGDTLMGNRPMNLIQNGSFEADNGFAANGSFWATGTTLLPNMSLNSWTSTGQSGTYASWGNDGGPTKQGSDLIPDGDNAVYFGGGIMGGVSPNPTYNPDGTVTFASSPVFVPKPTAAPVTLSQTVSGMDTSATYLLDFWTSGEDANFSQFAHDGFFGLDITGESQMYFAAPYGLSGLGLSQRYYILFKPTVNTVTFTWTNWGHYFTPGGLSTELVLDDVILNKVVPEPCSMVALTIGVIGLARRRRVGR